MLSEFKRTSTRNREHYPPMLLHLKRFVVSCISYKIAPFFFITGKTFCQSCKKKCSGEVLRVQDKYFHIGCFKCAQCNASLAQGGFFAREGSYYCTKVLERTNKKPRRR